MRDFELQGLKSLGSLHSLRVRVCNASGKETALTLSVKDKISAVKDRALGGEFHKDSSSYKLILAKCQRVLSDGKTVEEEEIQEDDELILLRRRQNTSSHEDKANKQVPFKVPDITTIQRLTLKLEARKKEEAGAAQPSGLPVDFNAKLRRILISLIDSSLLLQAVDESDDESSKAERLDPVDIPVDPGTLKKLTDMGFTEAKATKALRLHRMSPLLAMEWLLQHEGEPDQQEPCSSADKHNRTRRKRKEFTPNIRAVENLKEMGFQEEEIVVALKVTGNSQEAACEWLLGDKKGNLENIDDGLDPESPIYKAIMENPMVQLSLYNPRVLAAFEDMLENPHNSNLYISDADTGPVLLQISRIVQGFAR